MLPFRAARDGLVPMPSAGAMRETKPSLLNSSRRNISGFISAFILFLLASPKVHYQDRNAVPQRSARSAGHGAYRTADWTLLRYLRRDCLSSWSILAYYFISWFQTAGVLLVPGLVCIFNVPFVVYALLAWFQPSSPVLICSHCVRNISAWISFSGLYTFIMQQVCLGPHQMAHYAGRLPTLAWISLPGMISGLALRQLGRLSLLLHVGAAGHGSRLPACRAHSLHLSRY